MDGYIIIQFLYFISGWWIARKHKIRITLRSWIILVRSVREIYMALTIPSCWQVTTKCSISLKFPTIYPSTFSQKYLLGDWIQWHPMVSNKIQISSSLFLETMRNYFNTRYFSDYNRDVVLVSDVMKDKNQRK